MGKGEEKLRTRARKQNIKEALLGSIYAAGVVSASLLAPNAIASFLKLTGRRASMSGRRTFNGLLQKGLLTVQKTDKGNFVLLTPLGEKAIHFLTKQQLKEVPRKWDGKWRVVIYDINERKKVLRNHLRSTLVSLGFVKLQDSVWVYPYDCEDLITLIKADFQIGKEVLYLIVEHLENDKALKKTFKLT